MNQKIKSVWHGKFQSSNMVQLEQNKDIAYNAFLGRFKQFEQGLIVLFQTVSDFRFVGRRS